jgi:hypothetical protein
MNSSMLTTATAVTAMLGISTSCSAQFPDPAAVAKEAAAGLFHEQMRALQAHEDHVDYTPLLRAKERHDSMLEALLLPFLLENGRSPRLATLEFDYRPAAVATGQWPVGPVASEYWVTIRTNTVVRDSYPAAVFAKVRYQDDSATVDFLWHEPFLAYGRSGFCLTPTRTRLSISRDAFFVTDLKRGDSAGSTSPQEALKFRNPSHLYHWTDTAQVLWACYPARMKPSHRGADEKPADASYALEPYPIRHETFFEMRANTSELLPGVPSAFRPSRELEYLSGGRDVSWSLNDEGALIRLTTSAQGEVLLQCTYTWAPPKSLGRSEDTLVLEADRRAALLFTAINGNDKIFSPTFYTAKELASARGLLARLRLDHNIRAALWRASGEELTAAIESYSALLAREGLSQDFLLYNLEATGEWAARYAPATDLSDFLKVHLVGAASGLTIRDLCDHAARAIFQSRPKLGSIYLALALSKPATESTDQSLLSWASVTLSALPTPNTEVQPAIAACESAAENVTKFLLIQGDKR